MATDNLTPRTIEIQLTQGQTALIDAEFAELTTFRWRANFNSEYSGGGKYRASRQVRNKKKRTRIYLHRAVMELYIGRPLLRAELVDHINGDPLDNRICNLRIATSSQNLCNRGLPSNNTSGYKGIYYVKRIKRWEARIMTNGVSTHLGSFATAKEAYTAYCNAAIVQHGEFAKLK